MANNRENKVSETSNTGNNLRLPIVDGSCSGDVTDAFNAGYTTAIGDLMILVDGVWQKADANNAARYKGKLSIALEVQTIGKPVLAATRGLVYVSTWELTPNDDAFISETAGGIEQDVSGYAEDSCVRNIGHVITATVLDFNPSPDYLLVAGA